MQYEPKLVRETELPDPMWRKAVLIFLGLVATQIGLVGATALVLRLLAP